ncbi:MAG TPA: GntR family transcriptional regulator [Gaiellaceae bacterium]|nr:GntR family transcriptional regulator [Gaiellaceae bacterium]
MHLTSDQEWFTLDFVESTLTQGGAPRHPTMAEAALERLREAIILGELTPGTPLRLEDLARSLGMSISPIREAVRRLEALGLAEHVPHHGAKVVALDIEELRELFSIRLALEAMAVRRGAELFDEGDEQAARAHLAELDEARRAGDARTAVRAHTAFHFTLYEAARSGWLLRLIRPAWDSCERYRPVLLGSGSPQDRHADLDRELLDACTAHDPDRAADALHAHLELATDIYRVELAGRSIFAF